MNKTKISYNNFLKNFIKVQLRKFKDKEVDTNDFLNLITEPLRNNENGYIFPCFDDAIRFISCYPQEVYAAIQKMNKLNNSIDPIKDTQLFIDFMVDIDVSELLIKSETIIELISNNNTVIINEDVINLIDEDLSA